MLTPKLEVIFIWNLLYIASYIVSAYSNFPLQEIDNETPP